MARWQAGLEKRQGFLGRIVDIGAELCAMAGVCVRAEMQRSENAAEGIGAYELANVFCQQARLRIEKLFDGLFNNTDDVDYKLAVDTLEGRYSWLEAGIIDASEGTGPWIAPWHTGPSTEDNIARTYLPSTREEPAPAKPAAAKKRTTAARKSNGSS